jgi:Mn2+/Fe2+ NRAMP family transporter
MENEKWFVIGFIAVSTVVMTLLGQPATLLVLAGAVNGLILPLTLLTVLAASRNKKIVGENYKHPTILLVLGIVAVVLTGIGAVRSLPNILTIFG